MIHYGFKLLSLLREYLLFNMLGAFILFDEYSLVGSEDGTISSHLRSLLSANSCLSVLLVRRLWCSIETLGAFLVLVIVVVVSRLSLEVSHLFVVGWYEHSIDLHIRSVINDLISRSYFNSNLVLNFFFLTLVLFMGHVVVSVLF